MWGWAGTLAVAFRPFTYRNLHNSLTFLFLSKF